MQATDAGPLPPVASRHEWLVARKDLLVREKELNHLRDELAEQRRCPSCSFWADSFAGVAVHRHARLRVSGGVPEAGRLPGADAVDVSVVLLGAQRLQFRLRRVVPPGAASHGGV